MHVKLRATKKQATNAWIARAFWWRTPTTFTYTNALPKRYWKRCKLLVDKWNSIKNNKLLTQCSKANSRKSTTVIIKYSKGLFDLRCLLYRLRVLNAHGTSFHQQYLKMVQCQWIFNQKLNGMSRSTQCQKQLHHSDTIETVQSNTKPIICNRSFIHSCFEKRLQWLFLQLNCSAVRQCMNLIGASVTNPFKVFLQFG